MSCVRDVRGVPPTLCGVRVISVGSPRSVFSGDVRLIHPQMNMACDRITVDALPDGKRAQRMIAEPDVVFALTGATGQSMHGTGDRAVYDYGLTGNRTNELLTLTGKPAMVETTNTTFRNSAIVFDLQTGVVSARGKYRMGGSLAGNATNFLELPKTKFVK